MTRPFDRPSVWAEMGGRFALFLLSLVLADDFSCALGQDGPPNGKDLCKRNLRLIYDAIQAYRIANKQLPGSLSELFPKFLADPNVLICPVASKRGLTSIAATGRPGFSDPRTSYFYEFSEVPLMEVPGRSNRDWKQAQMGLLGPVVPIVRCLVHDRPINLSFGGELYESDQLEWEFKFTNLVEYARLSPEALLATTNTVRVIQIPVRDSAATSDQLDLSDYYNASLKKPWLAGEATHNLATLPIGLQELGAIKFDIRGVIQMSSPGVARLGERFPDRVVVPLNRSCHAMHFLLGSSLSPRDATGTYAGRIDIQFSEGQIQQIPLRLGTELGATWYSVKTSADPVPPTVVWQAKPPNTGRLFKVSWTNSTPEAQVRSIDCLAGTNASDFFLVALSVTP